MNADLQHRLVATATLATVLAGELKEIATGLPDFASAPTAFPLGKRLARLMRAAESAHFVGAYVGLREMTECASAIEARFDQEGKYPELIEQVKLLGAVFREVVLHLRRIATHDRTHQT